MRGRITLNIEEKVLNNGKSILTSYLLNNSPEFKNITTRPAVLIFPGGGYHFVSDREAEPVAMSFLAEGYNAFVLRYSVGEGEEFSSAFREAEEAIALIYQNANEWNVDKDKIAVIGFSAGGHLAASLATMGNIRPDALILGYPCILSSIEEVLAFPIPSVEAEVDASTPQTFLFSTFEDELVPVEHTLQFMQALNDYQIPFESHIFQHGKHGLSLAKSHLSAGIEENVNEDVAKWFDLSVNWLKKVLGDFDMNEEV